MTVAKMHNIHTKSEDFVQVYPQTSVKSAIYLRPPVELSLSQAKVDVVFKVINSLYGLKVAGKTWFEHLTEGLENLRFRPTESDPFIYARGTNMIVLYVDDYIILSRTEKEANDILKEIDDKGYKMTDDNA